MLTFATLNDMLLRRYVTDYIADAQNLAMPIYSQLEVDNNFSGTGDGVHWAINIDGNEVGGAWRGTDDNSLPSAGNERVKQHRVRPEMSWALN